MRTGDVAQWEQAAQRAAEFDPVEKLRLKATLRKVLLSEWPSATPPPTPGQIVLGASRALFELACGLLDTAVRCVAIAGVAVQTTHGFGAARVLADRSRRTRADLAPRAQNRRGARTDIGAAQKPRADLGGAVEDHERSPVDAVLARCYVRAGLGGLDGRPGETLAKPARALKPW